MLSKSYLVVDSCLLGLILCLVVAIIRGHMNHMINVRSQKIVIRFSLIFFIIGLLFYIKLLSLDLNDGSAVLTYVEPIAEGINGFLEGVALISFFYLIVIQVGGTGSALQIFSRYHGTCASVPTPCILEDSIKYSIRMPSSTQDVFEIRRAARTEYNQYRKHILQFVCLRPLFALAIGFVSNLMQSTSIASASYAKWVHLVLSTANVILTVRACTALVRAAVRLNSEIAPAFQLKSKLIIVKLLLLVSSFQWTIFCFVAPEWESKLSLYWTICLGEIFLITNCFMWAYGPNRFLAMANDSSSVLQFWDVLAHPIAECITVQDSLVSGFSCTATNKSSSACL